MSDLHYLGIAEAVERMARGEVSPVELTRALLDRIGELDGALHSFATVTPATALRQARAAEEAIAAGRRTPLLGIPLGIKDLFWTR